MLLFSSYFLFNSFSQNKIQKKNSTYLIPASNLLIPNNTTNFSFFIFNLNCPHCKKVAPIYSQYVKENNISTRLCPLSTKYTYQKDNYIKCLQISKPDLNYKLFSIFTKDPEIWHYEINNSCNLSNFSCPSEFLTPIFYIGRKGNFLSKWEPLLQSNPNISSKIRVRYIDNFTFVKIYGPSTTTQDLNFIHKVIFQNSS